MVKVIEAHDEPDRTIRSPYSSRTSTWATSVSASTLIGSRFGSRKSWKYTPSNVPYATFCPPPTQEAEHNLHINAEPQISPTEWGRANCVVHRLEKALQELIHLEKLAPIAHEILLASDALNPLAVVRVRRCPERHLVELASQMHKRYRKTRLPTL